MAARKKLLPSDYIGLSTDVKPVGVPVYSTFWESNTGRTYVAYDGQSWAADLVILGY